MRAMNVGENEMDVNNKNLCTHCFEEYPESRGICRSCGCSDGGNEELTVNLPIGTMLMGRYLVGKVLGKGGFGITYLAYDLKNEQKVAIKEYMPDNLSYRAPGSTLVSTYSGEKEECFKQGSEKFFEEAKTISRFNGHPNIINVFEFFYENNTAYFVMEYIAGVDLKTYVMQCGGKISEEECIRLVLPVMDALIIIHSIGILHRDISPDNIYVTKDGNVKLLDFGAARQVLGEKSKSLSVILKQGFAPIEQYQTKGNQGPWTDIYSLAATIYYCLVGQVPEAAMDRISREDLKTLPMHGANIQREMEKVLSKALSIKEVNRYQTMGEFKQAFANVGSVVARENKTTAVKLNLKRSKLTILIAAIVGAIFFLTCIWFAIWQFYPKGSNSIASNGSMSLNAGEVSSNSNPVQNSIEASVDVDNSSENTTLVEIPDKNQSNTTTENQSNTTVESKPETTSKPETSTKPEATKSSNVTSKPANTTEPTNTPTKTSEKDGVTSVSNVDYLYVSSVFSVKTKYTGEWKDNKPNGYGELIIAGASDHYAHGDMITGNFVNGDIYGQAKCEYADGTKYEGNFLNGLRQGKGTLFLKDGNKYVGQFENNLLDGQGILYFNDGAKYVGEFKHNSVEGKGIKYFTNGDRYEGDFIKANREGQGTYFFSNGEKYIGEWKNDLREGQGTMTWNTGNKYEGQWKNDVREGKGTYTWKDGRKYIGDWVNNTIEGQGSYYDMDGNLIKQGTWSNNNFVGE